jgi:hypothetical protein
MSNRKYNDGNGRRLRYRAFKISALESIYSNGGSPEWDVKTLTRGKVRQDG